MYLRENIFIGAGSNLGDSRQILASAARTLGSLPGIRMCAQSSIYCTEPQGDLDQPWFFNQVFCLQSDEEPLDLLASLQNVENEFGRKRGERRFGPRCLDLDLLLYGRRIMDTPRLCLPHPRMAERAFVLIPLLEIAPDTALPDGQKITALLAKLDFTLRHGQIWQSGAIN